MDLNHSFLAASCTPAPPAAMSQTCAVNTDTALQYVVRQLALNAQQVALVLQRDCPLSTVALRR